MSVVTKEKMLPKYPHLEWISYGSADAVGPEEPCCLPLSPGADDDTSERVNSPTGTQIFNTLNSVPGKQLFSCSPT